MPLILIPAAVAAILLSGCSKKNPVEPTNTKPITYRDSDFGSQIALTPDKGIYQSQDNLTFTQKFEGVHGSDIAIYTTNPNGYSGVYYQVRNVGPYPSQPGSWTTGSASIQSGISDILYIKDVIVTDLVNVKIYNILKDGNVPVKDLSSYIKYAMPPLDNNYPIYQIEVKLGINTMKIDDIYVAKVYQKIGQGYQLFWDPSAGWQNNPDIDPFSPSCAAKRLQSVLNITILNEDGQSPLDSDVIMK